MESPNNNQKRHSEFSGGTKYGSSSVGFSPEDMQLLNNVMWADKRRSELAWIMIIVTFVIIMPFSAPFLTRLSVMGFVCAVFNLFLLLYAWRCQLKLEASVAKKIGGLSDD